MHFGRLGWRAYNPPKYWSRSDQDFRSVWTALRTSLHALTQNRFQKIIHLSLLFRLGICFQLNIIEHINFLRVYSAESIMAISDTQNCTKFRQPLPPSEIIVAETFVHENRWRGCNAESSNRRFEENARLGRAMQRRISTDRRMHDFDLDWRTEMAEKRETLLLSVDAFADLSRLAAEQMQAQRPCPDSWREDRRPQLKAQQVDRRALLFPEAVQ